jgi:dipeptidase D
MSDNPTLGLKPEILWQRFYEISRVPRPSKNEGKMVTYLENLFKQLNVQYKKDKVGNLVAIVPASKGFENSPVVVLQGHIDMVCEKNKNTLHDFDKDPIKLLLKDGWITADGTTLGSDNGIGVAAALAVISDKDVIHGPIEILLTIDEETGLTGANNLEPGFISGDVLLNLDSEEEGSFYVGCSGGIDVLGNIDIELQNIPSGTAPYELLVTGLKGGHSGLDINSGKANAIKILARTLREINKINFFISKIEGGSKRNAIPREAESIIFLNPLDEQKVISLINEIEPIFRNEFNSTDNGLKIEFKKSNSKFENVLSKSSADKIINLLLALPHGVITMSQDIPDLVETSTNLATISTSRNSIQIATSQRSSIESAKKYIAESVTAVFNLANANVKSGDGYPGWKPNMDSHLLKLAKKIYKDIFNKEPEVKAIHAGLECGILGNKVSGLDMISFGPTILGAHSPDEKVNIESVDKFYKLLKSFLKSLAEEN